MEVITIVWLIAVAILVRIIPKTGVQSVTEANTSLCNTCLYAHVAHGPGGRKLTRCTYAWNTRVIRFAVSNCTMYRNRDQATQLVRITGFAPREPVAVEAVAQNQ